MITAGVLGGNDGREPGKRELYRWKDDRGVFHITDDAGKVPAQYRSKAEKFESVESVEPSSVLPQQGVGGGPAPMTPIEQTEQFQRGVWRARLKEWRDKLTDAEKRLAALEKKREEALQRWGGGAVSGRLNGVQEAQQIEQEIKAVQEEIDEAHNQIEVVIPEEARKAGVPPGWLRE